MATAQAPLFLFTHFQCPLPPPPDLNWEINKPDDAGHRLRQGHFWIDLTVKTSGWRVTVRTASWAWFGFDSHVRLVYLFERTLSDSILSVHSGFNVLFHYCTLSFVCFCLCIHLYPQPLFPPPLQCWMSAILPPALLFNDEANGGPPPSKATKPPRHWLSTGSLYSDWLAGRGLVALLVSSDLPCWPPSLGPSWPHVHMHRHRKATADYMCVWIKYAHELWGGNLSWNYWSDCCCLIKF